MKVDLEFKIQKFDGTEFGDLEQDGIDERGQPKFKVGPPLTLKKVCIDALIANYQDEQNLDAAKKTERGWLAQKIWNATDQTIDLSAEEVALIKSLIAKRYNPLIVVLAWGALDPDSKK